MSAWLLLRVNPPQAVNCFCLELKIFAYSRSQSVLLNSYSSPARNEGTSEADVLLDLLRQDSSKEGNILIPDSDVLKGLELLMYFRQVKRRGVTIKWWVHTDDLKYSRLKTGI